MTAKQSAIVWGILIGFALMYAYRMYRVRKAA